MVIDSGDAACDFLFVKPGDIVVVEGEAPVSSFGSSDWWMGYVLHSTGGARDPCSTSICQVACLDTGIIKTVNADLVKRVLSATALGRSSKTIV